MRARVQARPRSGGGVRSAALLAGVAAIAATSGFFAGRVAGDREARERRERAGIEADVAARFGSLRAEWDRGFDRAFALVLRRPHLELVDRLLSGLPLPVVPGPDGALAADFDEWALLRSERRDPDGAKALLGRSRELDPDPVRNRVRDAIEAGDLAVLRDHARDPAGETWPAATLVLLGRALAAHGAPDVAARLLERSIDREPGSFGLRLVLGDVLFRGGPPAAERARTHYGAALALKPSSVRAIARHGWLLADQAGEPSAAVAELAAAARRLPEEPVVAYVLGVALFRARHHEEARSKLQRALDLDSGFALALAALGEISVDQRDFVRAERAFQRSLELADTPEARDGLGTMLWLQGRNDAALELLEESVRRHPDDALLRDHLAAWLVQRGRFAEGLAHLREAAHLDEWLAEVQNDYAWELVNSGDPGLRRPGKALEHTQRACEMEPGNAWYRNTLGATWYRLGEYERCVGELETAADMPRGGGPYDLFFLAMAKHKLGMRADALELFAQAKELMEPGNDELVRLETEAREVIGAQEEGGS